jgi:coenzyme Q-binding protein COQ10
MTPLEHTVVIDRPVSDVYSLAKEVERYPEFLPGYLESRILENHDGRLLLARKARLRGTVHAWRSWVRFDADRAIHFEHAAGPLRGMQVLWKFSALSHRQTHLLIRHELHVRRGGVLGWLLEKFFFAPRLERMASEVIAAFKHACEIKGPAADEFIAAGPVEKE